MTPMKLTMPRSYRKLNIVQVVHYIRLTCHGRFMPSLFSYSFEICFSFREKVELYKELRKMRQRPKGVSAVALALGKKVAPEDEASVSYLLCK